MYRQGRIRVKLVRLIKAAEADLEAIGDWLAERNPLAAVHLLEWLQKGFRLMADNPKIGRPFVEASSDARIFVIGDYLVLDREHPDGLDIVRVVHGRRDRTLLFEC